MGGLSRKTGSYLLGNSPISRRVWLVAGALAFAVASPVAAQDERTVRTRIGLGPNAYPSYPGSDSYDIGPLIEFERARGDELFGFEAADDSFGVNLVDTGTISFGPVVNFEGVRTSEDVGTTLPKVKFSLEPGAAIAFNLSDNFRLRAEARKGVTGHKGWIGHVGADFVMREGDAWLFAIGPRLTWSDDTYQDAWFGVAPADAPAAGLPAFDAGGGIQAYGATASFLTQIGPRWGVMAYAKYDRLTGDPADSPIVLTYGSRDQLSGGLALTYVFGEGVD